MKTLQAYKKIRKPLPPPSFPLPSKKTYSRKKKFKKGVDIGE
jgi:hypothetical protein